MGDRERNPDRSRSALLDAAERLFAERGYAATSLADVGDAAGLSRGAPGYFFGSKRELYRAVLGRACDTVRDAVRSGRDRALGSGREPAEILAGAVGEYFDFLHVHADFVRLIERSLLGPDALEDELGPAVAAGHEALVAIAAEMGLDPSPGGDAAQLLLSILSLCWFAVIHADIVAPAVGVSLATTGERARRRAHIVQLVVEGARALAPRPAHSRSESIHA